MRIATICAFGLLATATACGAEPEAASPTFHPPDLVRLVTIAPATRGWSWPAAGARGKTYRRADIGTWETSDLQRALSRELEAAGFVQAEETTWWDRATVKGSSFAYEFDSPEGARAALRAFSTFAHRYQTEVERLALTDFEPRGLGEEGWGVHGRHPSGAESVELDWRRGNAVLAVYVSCFSECVSDIREAAGSWAAAVDAAALQG